MYTKNAMATVDQFDFKKLVLKRTPRVVDKRESTENNFWRRFQVRTSPECDRKKVQKELKLLELIN